MLHKMNPIRVQYILDKLQEVEEDENGVSSRYGARALSGLNILDVGCGGGLLSEVSSVCAEFDSGPSLHLFL